MRLDPGLNNAAHIAWEIAEQRTDPDFVEFAELLTWSYLDLVGLDMGSEHVILEGPEAVVVEAVAACLGLGPVLVLGSWPFASA